jgi:DNA-binding transcriptional regulator YhcF (GntR family)
VTSIAHLPTEQHVRHVRDQLTKRHQAHGKHPSVLELARQLGLSNTTFRRHFPDIARDVSNARRSRPATVVEAPATLEHTRLVARNAKLRRDNRQLREHLELAIANIQRLTLHARRLQAALEATTNVTQINPRARR